MDNLIRPAQPQPIAPYPENTGGFETAWGVHEDFAGFTKIEKAALMIAAGDVGSYDQGIANPEKWATTCVKLAKAILEEANK